MENLFYLQDSRSFTGSNVVFWQLGDCGYGSDLGKSQVYTQAEAQRRHDNRNSDIPLLKSLVDELSITAVDHQVLPEAETEDSSDEYVVQHEGYWNGNDIRFMGVQGETYEYNKAKVFSRNQISEAFLKVEGYTVFSKSALDKIARRTFQLQNIDKKTMIKKSGIKLVKPKKVRPTTGKTRGNCPKCGKITWDYNPYDNAYCFPHQPYLNPSTQQDSY